MDPRQAVVALGLLTVAGWRWWGLWRARPTNPTGGQTSTCLINVLALCGGILLAGWAAPVLAAAASAMAVVLPAAVLSAAPLIVTAAVLVAGLEVGCRGLGLWPAQRCPRLIHGPIAALLPVVILAGGPLMGQALAVVQASVPAAEAAEAVEQVPAAAVACIGPDGDVHGLRGEQLANAAEIVAVGREMGVPERGQVIAVATAAQESSLRNLDHGDRDSLGAFQQRPSQGWGSADQVRDLRYATRTFYDRLLAVPGWDAMPLTVAAQTVQRSGHPNAYARWEDTATAIVNASTCTTT